MNRELPHFAAKYHFDQLAIGESVIIPGRPSSIRTAAANWGTRRGIWLKTTKIAKDRVKVTRIEEKARKANRIDLEAELAKQSEALRTIALLVISVRQMLQEHLDGESPVIAHARAVEKDYQFNAGGSDDKRNFHHK